MRAQPLKDAGCGLVTGVLAGACLLLLAGCAGSTSPQFRILTPYGDFDGTTSQTITIDARPYFPPPADILPPPIDYSHYGMQTLEK